MKKQVPLFIGMVVGFFALAEFYIPHYQVNDIQERLLAYGRILAAAAFVLGGINVIQVNWPKIRRRESDWQYKIILLASAVIMALVGVRWDDWFGIETTGNVAAPVAGVSGGQAEIVVQTTRPDALVKVGGSDALPARKDGKPVAVKVEPGKHKVTVFMPVAGYGEYSTDVQAAAGQSYRVKTSLHMKWGKTGRVYTWFYDHVFDPCNSTMFALLAFFIASAAFRAFRARNTEAALLLGAAIIVMLGRAPIGGAIHEWFPLISDWIVDIPNNAGRRAIMMGAALGAIVTGLRVILGLERSHLGSE
jgi:hypothetical protein